MRILHCLAQLPMKTGSGVYFSTVVDGLTKKGHRNAVIYGTQTPFSKDTLADQLETKTDIQEFPIEFLTNSLPFPIAGMSDLMPYESTVYSKMTEQMYATWIKEFEKQLITAKKEFNPDVVITHHLFILSSLVKKIFTDIKVIGICHGTDIRQLKQHPWIKDKYIQHTDKLEQYLTVTPTNVDDIQKIFSVKKEKIKIIGGGFNPTIFNDNHRHFFDGTFRLMYAGKIAESKGVFELAKTLPLVLEQHPNTELSIIGNATDEQKNRLFDFTDNSKKLHVYNAINQIEMSKILKTMDIFILPSYYEALGLIAIEALACGTHVVATEIEGLITLLGKTVNQSGIIEYVPLPRIQNIDKAFEEDKPEFVKNLASKIIKQMKKIKTGTDIYPAVANEIKSHSWGNIINKIDYFLAN